MIHHTDCGMEKLTDDEFRAELEDSVRDSVQRLRESPFLSHRDAVRGYIYDVEEHQVREVE